MTEITDKRMYHYVELDYKIKKDTDHQQEANASHNIKERNKELEHMYGLQWISHFKKAFFFKISRIFKFFFANIINFVYYIYKIYFIYKVYNCIIC